MLVIGNYTLGMKFGGIEIPISPHMIQNVSVAIDIDRLVPTFQISMKDATGILGEIAPYDKSLNSIELQFARSDNPGTLNTFKLFVKRRKPDSDRRIVLEGILDVPDLMSTCHWRAWTGSIKTSLETLARELKISKFEISPSLDYDKTIIQPGWTNAKLLNYLAANLVGRGGETGYHCFIKNEDGDQVFVVRSMDEMLSSAFKHGFVVSHKPYKDLYPVVDYRVFDNSQLLVDINAKIQTYKYFNWAAGQYVTTSIDAEDCPSLGERTLIDEDNTNGGAVIVDLGRGNDFTPDFKGRVSSNYFKRINSFVNIWISTWGNENISPGDVVKLLFGEALARGQLFLYHLSGYWMVSRVVHVLGSSYMTNVLLTRNGIDTDFDTTLMKTSNLKRK